MTLTLDLPGLDRAPVYHPAWDEKGFNVRLYIARKRRGWHSQERFARETGLSLKSIEAWESGDRVPRADSLVVLCRLLKVSADWLLGLRPERKRRFRRLIVGRRVSVLADSRQRQ